MKKFFFPIVFFLLFSLFGGEKFSGSSYFTEEAVHTVDVVEIRNSGSFLLAELTRELPAYAKAAGKDIVLQRRLELLRRGITQLQRDLADQVHPERICHAVVEIEEMRGFRDYFREVIIRQARVKLPEKILNVTAFGAKGDGKTDNTEAFRQAFVRAMDFRGKYAVTIKIPDGVYYFADPRRNVAFLTNYLVPPEKGGGLTGVNKRDGYIVIGNQKNLTLTGSGKTELLFDRPVGFAGCINLGCCDNVTVKDLSIDYKMRPFTQGVIKEVNVKNCSVLLESDDPQAAMPGMKYFRRGHTWSFTPEGAFQWELGFFMMSKAEKAGPLTVRYFYGNKKDKFSPVPFSIGGDRVKDLKPGMKMVHISRSSGGGGVRLDFCRFCTIENVTVYASQAMAFADLNGYATTFRNCRIARKPGRMISTNGDCFHVPAQVFGCAIVNCQGEYQYDDGVNTYARHGVFERKRPSGSYSVSDLPPIPGSLVGLIDQKTGKIKALARCSGSPAKGYTFMPEMKIVTREMIRSGKIKDQQLPDSLICFNHTGEGFVALNTRFAHHHGKSFVIQSPHSMVENCSSTDPQQCGYHIGSMGDWGEYSRPHNIVIRSCRCDGGEYSLMTFYQIPGGRFSPCISLQDILLEGNSFANSRSGQRFFLHNTDLPNL